MVVFAKVQGSVKTAAVVIHYPGTHESTKLISDQEGFPHNIQPALRFQTMLELLPAHR